MNELNDKAYSTLVILRSATWLNNDEEIQRSCQEVAEYLKENTDSCKFCGEKLENGMHKDICEAIPL